MTQILLNAMAIPAACELNKPVFKKMFLENGELDATDKKALSNDIERIRWLYTLKPNTINIPKFEDGNVEYQEVAILQVDLTSPARAKRIASFINKAIPYPLFLINASVSKISRACKEGWNENQI